MQRSWQQEVDGIRIDGLIRERVPIVPRVSRRALMKFRIQILRLIGTRSDRGKDRGRQSKSVLRSKNEFLVRAKGLQAWRPANSRDGRRCRSLCGRKRGIREFSGRFTGMCLGGGSRGLL